MESGSTFHLIDVVRRSNVPFVIIGGHAVTYHGFVRATEDTDIVFLRTPENESALLDALTEVNACWIGDEIDPETKIEKTHPVSLSYIKSQHLMMLATDLGFLDVFDYIPGYPDESVEVLFQTAEEYQGYNYASLSWLRRMKTAANRAKDVTDLENLPEEP